MARLHRYQRTRCRLRPLRSPYLFLLTLSIPGLPPFARHSLTGNPCGPDLELAGDVGYLNFFAQAELVLPESFFNALDGTPFDRTSVDIGGQLEAVKPLLARTRDIRLLIMQARLQILNHDLAGFAVSVAAAAYWLDAFWDQVHPRPEGSEVIGKIDCHLGA